MYKKNREIQFYQTEVLSNFNKEKQKYDISISLETLEHLFTYELDDYIFKLSEATTHYLFVTIPNEKGIVLLIKYLIKKFFLKEITMRHNSRELLWGF